MIKKPTVKIVSVQSTDVPGRSGEKKKPLFGYFPDGTVAWVWFR